MLHENYSVEHALYDKVVDVIQTIYDPEIPVSIWELGLIYGILIDQDNNCKIIMTLTAPACPVAGTLPGEIQTQIQQNIHELQEVSVELVWDPPWRQDMMSDVAKIELGLF